MKLIIFLSVILSFSSLASEWRTPHGSEDISNAKRLGEKLKSTFLGVTGVVMSVHEGYGKPIYKLKVSDANGVEEILIGSLYWHDFQPGSKIEVLLDVLAINHRDKKAKALTEDKIMGLGICHVELGIGYATGSKHTYEVCMKWYGKSFPKDYKDRE
ncbi:hypothetical protein V6457_004244 [Vibrio vulnificus]|uniref:hypothetical protein n=1 Tax=Vibrio vulnificus TaxID=672 RepID=UPI00102900A4|nr:hypothetical protein [Vibrio vulnificus]EIO3971653.1 hypothetical protein [Vibrio vulnificus]EJV2652821.1 hypothetical protein [Vibrio vulnificus]RZQ36759.1 hypothetical protein D8T55_22985 [Vibrio vulnificus]HAS8151829.1 hypothetical protein [Vibrio vulnificus]HAS8474839.1 hypothetical protein [Vibrio vulnificus]